MNNMLVVMNDSEFAKISFCIFIIGFVLVSLIVILIYTSIKLKRIYKKAESIYDTAERSVYLMEQIKSIIDTIDISDEEETEKVEESSDDNNEDDLSPDLILKTIKTVEEFKTYCDTSFKLENAVYLYDTVEDTNITVIICKEDDNGIISMTLNDGSIMNYENDRFCRA